MNHKQWMSLAIRYAKKGEGIIFHEPYQSLLLVKDNHLVMSWYQGGLRTFPDALTFPSQFLGGELYLPYEMELHELFQKWILESNIQAIYIGILNTKAPKALGDWAAKVGITVVYEVYLEQALKLNEVYIYSLHAEIPFVTLSFGMSLDGKIATRTGDSKYISGPQSRLFVHQIRHRSEAILVGINTVLIDHPHLTTRLGDKRGRDAHRVILDSTLKIAPNEPIITQQSLASTLIVTRSDSDALKKQALINQGVTIIEITNPATPLDLHEMLIKLKIWGIDSLMVEGGSTIHYSFIEKKLFNRLFATISPIIIGGETAKSAVGGKGFATLAESTKLHFVGWHKAGQDYILEATPQIIE